MDIDILFQNGLRRSPMQDVKFLFGPFRHRKIESSMYTPVSPFLHALWTVRPIPVSSVTESSPHDSKDIAPYQ